MRPIVTDVAWSLCLSVRVCLSVCLLVMDKTDPDAVWNVYSGATNYSHVSGSRIPIP